MNPTNTAKAQVIDFVRSKNSSTLELKRGCIIEFEEQIAADEWITHHFPIVQCSYDEEGEAHQFLFIDDGNIEGDIDDRQEFIATKEEIEKEWTIIGSDMGLQELLIALQEKWNNDKHRLWLTSVADALWIEYDGKKIRYDLTKNLHQQSEEFYQAILPLIS